jgi:acyl-CoA thioesterase FadM
MDITVTIKKLGRTSVTYGFDFTHNGEPVARGQVTAVCCLVHPDRHLEPFAIPESVRRLLTAEA